MNDPPEGWINLSLIARALLTADTASLELIDSESGDAVLATLQAMCASEADATELATMLVSLNRFAAAALRTGRSERNHAWADALEHEFSSNSDRKRVTAQWSMPTSALGEFLRRGN